MAITLERLQQFPFLRPLDDAELARLTPHVHARHCPAGTIIFPDGEIGEIFCLLESGHVQIFKPTVDGDVILNDLGPGDPFGELSLLDGQPRSAAARAVDAVSILEIPKPAFLALIQRHPILLYQTALANAQRLRARDLELIRELQVRNQELRQLYETSLDITRHLELEHVLSAIAERAASLLDRATCYLYLYDSHRHLLVAQGIGQGEGVEVPRTRERKTFDVDRAVRPGEGATGEAFTSGEPVIRDHVEGKRGATHFDLAAPIRSDVRTLGTLTVHRPPTAAPFTTDDARLLLLLANQAAIAIDNARLYELSVEKGRLDGELRVAREVQHSLLPTRAPRLKGFQLAGLWQPAREVAGDFYDFVPLPGNCWGIVIADVSDKGVPAALLMAVTRSILRTSVSSEPTLQRALERANRLIAADASRGMFVTAFVATLDPRARRLIYVNAGHNPPLLLRAAGQRLERLSNHTLAFGIDPDLPYPARALTLDEGDVLLLYTDGVTDAVNARAEFFGEERLTRVFKTAAQAARAQAVVDALDHDIREFVGAQPLHDDVTLVVLTHQKMKRPR